ncbi:MAG: 3-methyl-2-oxobutanoate hydroxymethyltransferase [Proteobacteria bacterium]|nr:3-methyl-2-oxobutanoate hydroxymethyltransferase [Pseudomonadota bacterium]
MNSEHHNPRQVTTIKDLAKKKVNNEKIVATTCYDATMARLISFAQLDFVLIGDSLATVMMGHPNTLPVTIEHMVVYASSVSRVLQGPLLMADMPFMSYHMSPEQTYQNATRLMQQGGVHGLKLEGAAPWVLDQISHLVESGIPIMGHLGVTPQSVHQTSGYMVQGKEPSSAERLIQDAEKLDGAGVFALVLELVPAALAAEITRVVSVPVIGIGSGAQVDGQILVLQDLLGMNSSFQPKFVKKYCDLETTTVEALNTYVREVLQGEFPNATHSW